MTLPGIAPPRQLKGFADPQAERQNQEWFEWLRRLKFPNSGELTLTNIQLLEILDTAIKDRFIGHEITATGATSVIGELGWRFAGTGAPGGTSDGINSEPGHVGIRRIEATGIPATVGIDLNRAVTGGGATFALTELQNIAITSFEVRYINNLSNDPCLFGFGNSSAVGVAEIGSESFYVDIAAGGSFWRCSVRTGGATTTQTTTVPIVSNAWILWEIHVDPTAGQIRFYADGALVHTATSGLPSMTAIVSPSIRITEPTNGNHCKLDIDTFKLFLVSA